MASGKPKSNSPDYRAPLAAMVDELGALEKEFAPYKLKADRIEQLRKLIRAAHADKPAEQSFEVKGQKFGVIIGPRASESVVDYAKLWKIAPAAMRKIATVTLKALEGAVSPEIVAGVVSKQSIGTRSLKVFERGAA